MMRPILPDEWVPVWVDCRGPRPVVEWCDLAGRGLPEPFFDRTVEACLRDPFHQLVRRRTPIDDLAEASPCPSPRTIAGFVFHMGRCGSTLIAQLLASLPTTLVISEAQPIDALLRAELHGLDDATRIAWLRAMVPALGGAGRAGETRVVVKFHAWNTRHIRLVLEAFPGVPWVFVARNPVEVLVSLLERMPIELVPGLIEPGMAAAVPASWAPLLPAECLARFLGETCRSALASVPACGGLVVDHAELPGAAWGAVLERLAIGATPADRERMRVAAGFDAKEPGRPFVADSAAKRGAADDALRRLAAVWVDPAYEQLAALRGAAA